MKVQLPKETVILIVDESQFTENFSVVAACKSLAIAKKFIDRCKVHIKNGDVVDIGGYIIDKDSKLKIYDSSISKNIKREEIPVFNFK